MTNRHLARSISLQSLFEWDFNNLAADRMHRIVEDNAREFAPGMSDARFIHRIVNGVIEKQATLDDIISKAAPEWPLARIATVDRNVLRIGLYELIFVDRKEVPAKVAINEAIELAKTFGGESSGKFVNGVLGTVYKELGEPGKEEKSKKKKGGPGKNSVSDYAEEELAQMEIEELAGGVVFTVEHGEVYLALVHDIFGYWTLAKGKLKKETNETREGASMRKVAEELGIEAVPLTELESNEYIANDPERGQVRKRVTYFLLKAEKRLKLTANSSGLDDSRWFPLEEVAELSMYDDLVPILTKAVKLLSEQR